MPSPHRQILPPWMREIFVYVLVGVSVGFAAVGLSYALSEMTSRLRPLMFDAPTDSVFPPWLILTVVITAGLFLSALLQRIFKSGRQSAMNRMIEAFHDDDVALSWRDGAMVACGTVATLAAGGSGGMEGPTALLGASFGSGLAKFLRTDAGRTRLLILSGVAGAIGALFGAPLGAAMFAAEVLYKEPDFEHEAIMPSLIASVSSYTVFRAFMGERSYVIAGAAGLRLSTSFHMVYYLALGILLAGGVFLWKVIYHATRNFGLGLKVPWWLKPVIGGILLSVAAGWFSHVLGTGHEYINSMVRGDFFTSRRAEDKIRALNENQVKAEQPREEDDTGKTVGHENSGAGIRFPESPVFQSVPAGLRLAGLLLFLALLKAVATGVTNGFGGYAGLLAPTLWIGGSLAAAYFCLLHSFGFVIDDPDMNLARSLVLVGMAAFYGASTKTPISAIIMTTEMSGSYDLIVPLMLTVAVAWFITRNTNIFPSQRRNRSVSDAHIGDYILEPLRDIPVIDAMQDRREFTALPYDASMEALQNAAITSGSSMVAVLDEKGKLLGLADTENLPGTAVQAADAAQLPNTTHPDESVYDALKKMTACHIHAIAVIERDTGEWLGVLDRYGVHSTYNEMSAGITRFLFSEKTKRQRPVEKRDEDNNPPAGETS